MRVIELAAAMTLPWIRTLTLALTAVVISATGCDQPGSETAQAETGSVSVVVLALSASDVSSATLSVSAPDIATPIATPMVNSGGQWHTTLGGIPAGSGRVFVFSAKDSSGNELYHGQATGVTILANQTQTVTIVAQQSSPPTPFRVTLPVIDVVRVSSTNVGPGGTVNLSVTAHGADQGDTLTYAWTAEAGSLSASATSSTTWTAPNTPGSYRITVSVHGRQQEGVASSVEVVVSNGQPPESPALVPVPVWAGWLLALLLAVIGRASIQPRRGRSR
jgi:hypothetical protein